MLLLGVETSCDETTAAIVADGREVRSNVIGSQVERHRPYGGVVPEIAARAHLELLVPTIDRALIEAGAAYRDLDGVAVTAGPGLVGALLVGVAGAKGVALAHDRPLIGVNHLEGHVCAAQLEGAALPVPLVALVVSGGHTSVVHLDAGGVWHELGSTIDDAAGEAYDKVARFLGLAYPGGPEIDRLASDGDPTAIAFPRALAEEGYDFSLSGLKTAVVRELRRREAAGEPVSVADVAASFQEAVVDVQVAKTMAAAQACDVGDVLVVGGVAANSRLRAAMDRACQQHGRRLHVPSPALCTDNAAMIAAAGANRLAAGQASSLELDAQPGLSVDGLTVPLPGWEPAG